MNFGEKNEYISWNYTFGDYNDKAEKVGHGGIDVRAFIKLHAMGYGEYDGKRFLSRNKLEKMGRTLDEQIYRDKGMATKFIDGTGTKCSDTMKIMRWIGLNEFLEPKENAIYNKLQNVYQMGYVSVVGNAAFSFTQYLYVRGGCHGQDGCHYPVEYGLDDGDDENESEDDSDPLFYEQCNEIPSFC